MRPHRSLRTSSLCFRGVPASFVNKKPNYVELETTTYLTPQVATKARRGESVRQNLRQRSASLQTQSQANTSPLHGGGDVRGRHLRLRTRTAKERRQERTRQRHADCIEVRIQTIRQNRFVTPRTSAEHRNSRQMTGCCSLRGLHTDTPAHPLVVQLHTGAADAALTRPSMGYGQSGSARLRDNQSAAEFRRGGELRQRLPTGAVSGKAHQQ